MRGGWRKCWNLHGWKPSSVLLLQHLIILQHQLLRQQCLWLDPLSLLLLSHLQQCLMLGLQHTAYGQHLLLDLSHLLLGILFLLLGFPSLLLPLCHPLLHRQLLLLELQNLSHSHLGQCQWCLMLGQQCLWTPPLRHQLLPSHRLGPRENLAGSPKHSPSWSRRQCQTWTHAHYIFLVRAHLLRYDYKLVIKSLDKSFKNFKPALLEYCREM